MNHPPPLNSSPTIKLIEPHEANLFLEHLSRNIATSGIGDTPIFSMIPRESASNLSGRLAKTKESLSLPIAEHGWQRIWGASIGDSDAGQQIVGSATLSTSHQTPSQMHRAALGMGIERSYRAAGLGRQLLSAAIAWAVAQPQLYWIDLGVFGDNLAARKLYKRFGFIETGRAVDFCRLDGQRIDDIQMRLELNNLR